MIEFAPSSEYQVDEYVYKTPIEGLYFIQHKHFPDNRGFYAEIARLPELESVINKPFHIKQLNMSHSKTNVVRGIHAESWNKLLTVTNGSVFGAWVDLRPESSTFAETLIMKLGTNPGDSFGSVYVSKGIGNSFLVTDGPADYIYAVDALYQDRDPAGDIAISLFDPDLAINWPLPKEQMIISDRDLEAISLRERFPDFQKQ